MRRAAAACLVLAAAAGVETTGVDTASAETAGADPKMSITADGGTEVDSNVQRSETGPGLTTERVAAPVARLGAKLARGGRLLRGGYALGLGAQSRTVLSGDSDLSPENELKLWGDLRWMRRIGQRPVSAGFGLSGIDALPTTDDVGARTFRTFGAQGLLSLRGSEGRALTIAFGGRDFVYKPDHRYDWRGPTASVRLDLTLWERDEGARSVELSAQFEFEARAYDSVAYASACQEGAPPKKECYAGTTLQRSDRFQRGALELTWTGRFVAAASYQLSVTDSNSYGQSIVRHRATLSATRALPWRFYGSALATLQLDHYPDGLPVDLELVTQTFTALDDENRSSFQVRLARHFGEAWAIEGRGGIWRDLGSELDTAYRRFLVYAGAVYSR